MKSLCPSLSIYLHIYYTESLFAKSGVEIYKNAPSLKHPVHLGIYFTIFSSEHRNIPEWSGYLSQKGETHSAADESWKLGDMILSELAVKASMASVPGSDITTSPKFQLSLATL